MDENICDTGKKIEESFHTLTYDKKIDLKMYKNDEIYQKIEQFYDLENSFLDSTSSRKFFSNFIFGNNSTATSFVKTIKDNFEELCRIEEGENYLTRSEVEFQLNLALKFMHYFETEKNMKGLNNRDLLNGNSDCPLYEVLLNFYVLFFNNVKSIGIVFDKRRAFFWEKLSIFLGGSFKLNLNHTEKFEEFNINTYSTMIVTKCSDYVSAADFIANSFNENSIPWKIRNLLVQESISVKFFEVLASRLRPFDEIYLNDKRFVRNTETALTKAKEMGLTVIQNEKDNNPVQPTIVLGQNRKYFDDISNKIVPALIVANCFRTIKECLNLFNGLPSPSAVIWSENMSTAYELINTLDTSLIWVNCHKKFIPCHYVYLNELCNHSISQIVTKAEDETHKNYNEAHVINLSKSEFGKNLHQQLIRCCSRPSRDSITSNGQEFRKRKIYHGEELIQIVHYNESGGLNSTILGSLLFNHHKTVITQFGVTFGN